MKKTTFNHFINMSVPKSKRFNFISLFSSAGIADYGLTMAGGKCLAACEIDLNRRKTHQANFSCPVFEDIKKDRDNIIEKFKNQDIDVVIATPPCQSFSTANSARGSRKDHLSAEKDSRNTLFLDAIYIAQRLKPKFVIFENVPNFLERIIKDSESDTIDKIGSIIEEKLADYMGWKGSLCCSNFGVPQSRKRSLIVYVRRDFAQKNAIQEEHLNPLFWNKLITDVPQNLLELFDGLPSLDSSCEELSYCESDNLHIVPVLKKHHYSWIKDIPAYSGKSAWENDCPTCHQRIKFGEVYCPYCNSPLLNRPHMENSDGSIRAIKGFKTSYRRMSAVGLASTITTNSGAFSSDIKLHPVQNRVLSVRECALVQTIPYSFKWPEEQLIRKAHRIREMIGEAVPCAVTYHIGYAISKILGRI